MEVSEAASNVTYKIDDRTGPWIDVKRWMDEQVTHSLFFFFFSFFLFTITLQGCIQDIFMVGGGGHTH